jgi:hypothetical protein
MLLQKSFALIPSSSPSGVKQLLVKQFRGHLVFVFIHLEPT